MKMPEYLPAPSAWIQKAVVLRAEEGVASSAMVTRSYGIPYASMDCVSQSTSVKAGLVRISLCAAGYAGREEQCPRSVCSARRNSCSRA